MSRVAYEWAWASASRQRAASSPAPKLVRSVRTVARTAAGELLAIRAASGRAASTAESATAATSPSSWASVASTRSAPRSSFAAACGPTSAGNVNVEPMPGCSPSFRKLTPSLAPRCAMRTSVARARQRPAPTAWPLIAAMTGTGSDRTDRNRS
eukprot:Amastigsp_a180562_9.p3 type:complete len:154 gc:universal Amastigsp_a180562_9:844-383(-)